jgi:Ran GTPase-activating protein (RanGAP) involved in mRNA processing and transport
LFRVVVFIVIAQDVKRMRYFALSQFLHAQKRTLCHARFLLCIIVQIKSLSVRQNRMSSQSIAVTFTSLDEVKSVNLRGTSLSAEGVSMLADALTSKTSVTHIDIGRNKIGDDGAAALADMLKITRR